MRRNVRYSPLGPARQAKVIAGMTREERSAEIIDESATGYGLRMGDVSGLEPGQKVTVRLPKGDVAGIVMRIEPIPKESRYLVGILVSGRS